MLKQLKDYENKHGSVTIKKYKTLRSVIRAKCADCSGTTSEVVECTVFSCPLWAYRTEEIQSAYFNKEIEE